MDVDREIEQLKQKLRTLQNRTANTMPRPQTRRAKIVKLGEFEVHEIEFIDGKFTEDLVTDDLTNRDRGEPAHVGDDFGFDLEVGDRVNVARCEGRWWIVTVLNKGCTGYCIDDQQGQNHVYGWFFNGPALSCCPEAGGTQILTTADGGVTYVSEDFQCNGAGDNRKWIFDGSRLRISGMLEEGNIEYRTDRNVKNCSIVLQHYEPLVSPIPEDCGKLPIEMCLNPLCGVGTCADCEGLSPMALIVDFGGGGVPDPDDLTPAEHCSDCSGIHIFHRKIIGNSGDHCWWERTEVTIPNTAPAVITVTGENPSVMNASCFGVTWTAEGPFDCMDEIVLDWKDPAPSLQECVDYPLTISVKPFAPNYLEGQCYPKSTGFVGSTGVIGRDHCQFLPYYLEFELTDVTDGTCNVCDGFNDIHRASLQGNAFGLVKWETASFDRPCATFAYASLLWRVELIHIGGSPELSHFRLVLRQVTGFLGDFVLMYKGPHPGDWNCFGPNTFNKDFDDGDCTWPATITTKPII